MSKSPSSQKTSSTPQKTTGHGSADLPSVTVEDYNLELRDKEGFIGDRASKRAFTEILQDWRERLRKVGEDPLGDGGADTLSKRKLDAILQSDDIEAIGVIQSAIEEFANELASVLRRFVRSKGWQEVERIAVGGGFRRSRVGELAIGRAAALLKADGLAIELRPIRHHPNEAGLIGAAHLMPAWTLEGFDGFLAVDVGGTNIRTGVVVTNVTKAPDLSQAEIWKSELWRHVDDKPSRTAAVERLTAMLKNLMTEAGKSKVSLAPLLGIGCPGLIEADGSIDRGGQNLPGGNWESSHFNLPQALTEAMPQIGKHQTMVVMHNDAVVQGLSEVPYMQDVKHWAVVTIGTGLGNACFANKVPATAAKK